MKKRELTRDQLQLLLHLNTHDKFDGKTILEVCWMLGQEASGLQQFSMSSMTSDEQLEVLHLFHIGRNEKNEFVGIDTDVAEEIHKRNDVIFSKYAINDNDRPLHSIKENEF